MVKEMIVFRLPLATKTDDFFALYRQVAEEMEKLGAKVGVSWTATAGTQMFMVERGFDSLAAYEGDDAAFHGGAEFMALWRRMEGCAESMETTLWQTRRPFDELAALRAHG